MSLENDIFNNPLEAFPEFIDEAVPQPSAEPVTESDVSEPKKKYVPSYSSSSYVDPLDTVEEIDLSTLSQAAAELEFTDDDISVTEADSESSYFEKTNLTIGTIEYEDVAVRKTDGYLDIDDSVPDEAPVIEEVSVDDFLSDTGSATEEIDLDAFLGDSGFSDSAAPSPVSGNITEEISLDDFGVDFNGIDAEAINAFAASTKQEKSDIENAPALDMELEFDDDFVLETKANPEDDIDFDFEALMAGESIQIPQTASTGDELLDNFDDIFDTIVDETAPTAASSGTEIEFDPSAIEEVSLDDFGLGDGSSVSTAISDNAEKITEQQIVFDEVSEFDDLLSSFSDETHVEVADNRKNNEADAGPHDYNIIVVMDEDETESSAQIPQSSETDEEEDYVISIFADENEAESFRNHRTGGIPVSDNSGSFSFSSDAAATVSDSFEDISLDDFGVTFEDETPAEKPAAEEPAVKDSVSDEPVFEEEVSEEPVSEDNTQDEEPSEIFTECEDTTIDNKKIVELSEDCVYNGDNTEYTPDMIDGYSEEISDTMDSMNEGLLEKIVSELSVLRTEMQSLRDEVQTLKEGSEAAAFESNPEPVVQEDVSAIPEEEIPVPEADPFAAPQEAGGFFSGDDDDETIALSGDELNNILNSADFTQEDGSNFGMEAPEGSVIPDAPGDDFAMDVPAAETEETPAEESVSTDDFTMDIPAEEPAAEDFSMDIPAEEPAAEDFSMDAPAEEESVSEEITTEDFSMDEPAAEETSESTGFETEEVSIDDFNTDLPSLKEEAVTEEPALDESAAEEAAPSDDFSLDDFDIPEPSVEENSIADIDIDEPEITDIENGSAPSEEFSLDEFDIPEPSVEESSIDIAIDEPAADIPADQPEETSDADFYANSDSPAISEDDMTTIDIQENLEEPVLDDIDFGMDEPQNDDIEIPTGESLIVDSSSTDFLEEDEPSLDEQLTSEKVDYLNEEASVDDLGMLPEVEEAAVEGMEDSLEIDTLATSEDETPADDVFASQWDSITEDTEEAVPDTEPDKEEFVQASASFDDPVSFDIDEPAAEIPADEPEFDAVSNFEAPAEEPALEEPVVEETPAEEPAFEAPAPAADSLEGDIKQEVKSVLKYMDQLLENLPEDKIAEFAQSEHFETYKKLFNELGLV